MQPSLVRDVASPDPNVGLQAVAALRRLLEEIERIQVDNAREQGWTWQEIGNLLGVAKQSVHEKHALRGRRGRAQQ